MIRKILIFLSIFTLLVIIGLFAIHIWIGSSVRQHIELAKTEYPGTAEEALISFLLDNEKSPYDRTHIAIWSLGQIKSEIALPILKELYKDDPKGESCYGKHDSLLCQYEIYKAIQSIEKKLVFLHPGLNK